MPDAAVLDPGEFRVEYDGPEADNAGNINATDGVRDVIVQCAPGQKSWVRHRVAKGLNGAERRVFIVELEGVRLYVKGDIKSRSSTDHARTSACDSVGVSLPVLSESRRDA